ncbi:hypothetical protein DPMN_158478 [Dreissena polymorpha]|uniref:Uncharacterized protein n=1 Tax=Dreissena polymorpha TaxID=45954 RepID=A0A9D4EJW5_DREPO|nr:hypothetical protein DPMN_158478 [Dreissena polymorpha]
MFCRSLSCMADLPPAAEALVPRPAGVVVVVPPAVPAEVVVVPWEGRATAVTGLGWVGVSDAALRVPGEDCTRRGLERKTDC